TTLIVNGGQVAIFVKGGQMCDVFNAGTHVLSKNNIPILHNIVNLAYGGETPFSAEIYFINLTVKMDLYWGTTDPIQLIDPKYFVKL
ncbi:SPFH domain-containing protein, partial [Lysinibacillus sp. D4B1_S16]|uniref:SPFH domain-containing protein n=1 Tax=Lysinibacillus sp. D4B1_S16 TaxID=2941231 RepID=UPI0020BE27A9